MLRVAVVSVHGCPNIQAGKKDAGGMNIYVLETARRLAEMGAEVDVFTRHHDPLDPQIVHLTPGARLIHLTAGPPSTDKAGVYELLPEFTDQLLRFSAAEGRRYDVVTTHYWLSGLVGCRLKQEWDVPHVTSFHTLAEIKRRAWPGEAEVPERAGAERDIAASADRIVVWTRHEREALAAYYGADPGKIAVIPPGVDTGRFAPGCQREARERLGINGEKIILYVGRLDRLKGVDILLHTMASLEYQERARLYVIGGSDGGPELERMRKLCREMGLDGRVRFLGSMPQEELSTYYTAADICVLPSHYESFGLAALEAAACGKPVVASRVGGLTSVVVDGKTGYLVPWQCPGPFVERLELLLENDRLRLEMGRAARRHAETLTWEVGSRRLLAFLEQTAHTAAPMRSLGVCV